MPPQAVYRESLPMGYAHAANALIPQAKYAFAVCHHDDFDLVLSGVSQDIVNLLALLPRKKQPPGAPINI